MRTLQRLRDDPQQQCRDLLALLHASENPQAFVQLYDAIKEESHLQWLIDRIDNLDPISVLPQRDVSYELTGKLYFKLGA